jgi:two-component system sensor histidine kinase RegB
LDPSQQPLIWRKPEVIHGVRNLVQNAVDFGSDQVWVEGEWGDGSLRLQITDDGAGFPPDLLGRLGDPFLRRRGAGTRDDQRPGYEGMGLGLFIAKTLLERSGAQVRFFNASDPFLTAEETHGLTGARVEVVWPDAAILAERPDGALGPNEQITS